MPSLLRSDASPATESARGLDEARRRYGLTEVIDTSALTRGIFSTDASVYRVVPQAVARPRSTAELVDVIGVARELGLPVTARGGGTSIAGNAIGPGIILNTSKHLNRVVSIDPEARTATVEPGVVQAALQRAAAPYGLRFGPDPSTHTRCTIGGMIGNNACGPRALGYGKTAENVLALEVVTGSGERLRVTNDNRPSGSPTLGRLQQVVADNLGTVRTEFGRFGRQVSGYSLEHLLPERRFDVARFLAGTEGTLGVMLNATVRLVADPPHTIMVALGYPNMAEAADATPAILAHDPRACEGIDSRIIDVVRAQHGAAAVPPLPRGAGWMFVELAGEEAGEVADRAERVLADSGCLDGFVVTDPAQALALWKIREDGAGLASVSLRRPAWAGWEDSAVPPEHLGSYLRAFDQLMSDHELTGLPYGHFGDGCTHIRIDFPLGDDGGVAVYRSFVEQAADLVASFGGSMSGEHGDGRARSELLPRMYSPQAIELFGAVKSIFDPENALNPGVLAAPRPLDADLRVPQARRTPLALADPHLNAEVHHCTGVGKCLANTTPGLGVMCPSFLATGDEKDSTRGRARALQEMINGQLIADGYRSPEVHEALDLCLSCKGCRRDCPTGIDMAAYKARVLDHSYRGRLRPRSHYALGWLPRWGRLITRVPGLAGLINVSTAMPGLRSVVRWSAGVDQRRSLPRFAASSASTRARIGQRSGQSGDGSGRPVILWVDSFSDCFTGGGVQAAVEVLEDAGYAPQFLERSACCGLTWISTGQLDGARNQLRGALDQLHPHAVAGTPIVGLEPSCLAVWRSDAPELLDDPRVAVVAGAVQTLAELLTSTPGWRAPDLSGTEVVAQPHCHHASVIGWQADAALLAATGATMTTVGGCCGLAGNFGVERGHYEVSVKVAEHDLLPAVRARPDALVLADGFSCRTQLAELADRQAITLAELLLRGRRTPSTGSVTGGSVAGGLQGEALR